LFPGRVDALLCELAELVDLLHDRLIDAAIDAGGFHDIGGHAGTH